MLAFLRFYWPLLTLSVHFICHLNTHDFHTDLSSPNSVPSNATFSKTELFPLKSPLLSQSPQGQQTTQPPTQLLNPKFKDVLKFKSCPSSHPHPSVKLSKFPLQNSSVCLGLPTPLLLPGCKPLSALMRPPVLTPLELILNTVIFAQYNQLIPQFKSMAPCYPRDKIPMSIGPLWSELFHNSPMTPTRSAQYQVSFWFCTC